jgi:ABC transporter substrate binding protein (PQQ-dependent alcohol dehydrogenase system)
MRLAALALLAALPAVFSAQAATFKVTLLVPADDPRLERARLDRAFLGHAGGPAGEALQIALNDARFELEAAGAKIELATVTVADAAAARSAAAAAEKAGNAALLADLPAAWLLAVADGAAKLPLLNISATSDTLRQADCRKNLFHLALSERMRTDALAQTLTARKWTNVLLLTGPTPEDQQRSAVAQASIKRYGLKLAGSKPFKLSADPRERDLGNPLLLTQGSYDAVWVVDSDGEFAQNLPYRTALPRPVVGDGGLVPLGWSDRFERYGAPQVSRRMVKNAKRPMTAPDWAAWMAGKAVAAAAVAAPKGPNAAFASALAGLELDGSKGVSMSFRPWDGQLRQPVLLSDGQAVVAQAPIDGLLHPKNNLDTLGADAPEKLCKARQ